MPLRPRLPDRDQVRALLLARRCSRAHLRGLVLPHLARAIRAVPASASNIVGAARNGRAAPTGGYAVNVTGSVMTKAVSPGTLRTSIAPPWALTSARTMASPKPVLPARRDRDESPRAKRSKISGC